MTSDDATSDWQELRALFAAAMAQPVNERAAFLANECGDRPELKAQVEDLLESADTADADFVALVQRAAADAVGDVPDTVGPYRILRLLAEGGMGRVFLAERIDQQYEQQVAIKLLSPRIPTRRLLQRFRAERQILANLSHPNIARLLDGGETDGGLPYLVMEFVDGVPLFEYCAREKPGLRRRLELFTTICDAIQHAHQNLVVHRDIKSTNIFVTADEEVKLLDFGIAKLLQPDDVGYTMAITVADARLLTPANASPEQISGDQITVATDVYQLGLLLYELLTDQPPYAIESLTPGELESIIRDTMPARPSMKARDRLRKSLTGDLDTIVMKALRKNPARRYVSPRALADDVERYLDNRPVEARPDSRLYRLGKFLRRNPLGAAASAVIGLLILSFATVTWLQNERISAERDTAEAVSDFMIEIFTRARPEESPGETVTARQVLDSAYARIGTELGNRPDVQARLLWVMGESYTSLGLHDDAARLLGQAAELGSAGHLPADDLVDVLANAAQEASYLDRHDEAARYIEQAEATYASIDDPDPTLGKIIFKHHANFLRRSGDWDSGMAKLLRAEEIARGIEDDVHGDYPDMLHEIGAWNLMRGEFEESEVWLRRALAHPHPSWRDPTNRRAVTLGVLGSTLRAQGRYDESLDAMHEALTILQREVGPEHINVGITHGNMAVAYTLTGDLEAAEANSLRALEITAAALGPEHSRMGTMYGGLATIRERQGRYAEALELLEQSLAIKQKSMADDNPSIGLTQRKAGVVLRELEQHDASLARLELALEIFSAARGAESVAVAEVLAEVGLTQIARGDVSAAADALDRALRIFDGQAVSASYVRALRGRAALNVAQGDCNAATAATKAAHELAGSASVSVQHELDLMEQSLLSCSL